MADRAITLRADHGAFCSAEDGGGTEGAVVDGRPAGLMTATREQAGAWETITVRETDEPGIVGLVSVDHGGRVLCCENAEADAAAGRSGILVFRSDAIGAWESFRVWDLDGAGARVAFEAVCRPGWFVKAWPDGRVSLDQPMAEGEPTGEPGGYETFLADPPLAGAEAGDALITGQLRITGSGFADDVGPVLPVGIHLGDAFSRYTREPDKAIEAVEAARAVGYQLVQFWLNLGTGGGEAYWAGKEIGPEITPDYWGQLGAWSDELDRIGIKGIYCVGDFELRSMSHEDFAEQLGGLLASRDTAGLVIAGNEAWQTGADSIADLERFVEAFRGACPDVPITTTSPPSEHCDDIAAWCGGDYYAIHGYRGGEDHDRIRHVFSVPWEGKPPAPFGYQDEPTGPGDAVSVKAAHCYEGRDVDACHMAALALQSLICDQGFNFFCGDGVCLEGDVTRWAGFAEVPRAVSWLPMDLMGWPAPFHFGDSQGHVRIFRPSAGKEVRFDMRAAEDGRLVGLLYGDESRASVVCVRPCEIEVLNLDGAIVVPARGFAEGDALEVEFVRSQGGAPGRTCFFVRGRLA